MSRQGFTILEIAIALTVVGLLTGISAAGMGRYIERARMSEAVVTMKGVEDELRVFKAEFKRLPNSLAELGGGVPLDPWGNPYQYTNLETAVPGMARKDKFLVPINSDFDLWSMGPDGKTSLALTAKASRDDVIRANSGGYYGVASAY